MKTPHKKYILKVSGEHAKLLQHIAIELNCSNLRAIQFILSYIYKLDSVGGKYWSAQGYKVSSLYIPMTDEQFQARKKLEAKLGIGFHALCQLGIEELYVLMTSTGLDLNNPSFKKYLQSFCRCYAMNKMKEAA
ncbi:hypothetical protein [Roseateles sp. PN1]|uniref:hypothetical protein n=1 Tax=Roseateles sp. PN1 TaxID=3137372 RepID=UPI0031397BB1